MRGTFWPSHPNIPSQPRPSGPCAPTPPSNCPELPSRTEKGHALLKVPPLSSFSFLNTFKSLASDRSKTMLLLYHVSSPPFLTICCSCLPPKSNSFPMLYFPLPGELPFPKSEKNLPMHLWTIDLATAELNAQTTFHLSCPSEVQKNISVLFSEADACTSAISTSAIITSDIITSVISTSAISTSAIITSAISTSVIIPSASLPPINIYSLTKLASDKLLTGRGRSLPLPMPLP